MISPENFRKARGFGGGENQWKQHWEGGRDGNKSKDRHSPGRTVLGKLCHLGLQMIGASGKHCVSVGRVGG